MKSHRLPASKMEHNVQSIWAIPESQLPNGPARDWLLNLAWQGDDIEAYTPYQPGIPVRDRIWWVFIRDKRCSVIEFHRQFHKVPPITTTEK